MRDTIAIPKVVVIGGGTGTYLVLGSLKHYPVELAAIVSMADDGGSTGILRDQYGVLPPGDIRRALVALSQESASLRKLFNYRFGTGNIAGHSFGNLFLGALEKIEGSFERAVDEAARILNVNGNVIPVTLNNVRLHARLGDGSIIRGEKNIDVQHDSTRAPIERVWLKPRGFINPRATKAISGADFIIIGPGDLYTSLAPNLLVAGMPETIKKSKAKKIYVANLMTKHGETDDFTANKFVSELERYLGTHIIDYVILNSKKPSRVILARYAHEKSFFVEPRDINGILCIKKNLLAPGKLIRHDKRKLGSLLFSLIKK